MTVTETKRRKSNLDYALEVVETCQAKKVQGVLLDLTTARLMVQVGEILAKKGEESAAYQKFLWGDPGVIGRVCWKFVK